MITSLLIFTSILPPTLLPHWSLQYAQLCPHDSAFVIFSNINPHSFSQLAFLLSSNDHFHLIQIDVYLNLDVKTAWKQFDK